MSDGRITLHRSAGGVSRDSWRHLRSLTTARIALNRAHCSLPTNEVLAFGLAHAQARDAVNTPLRVDLLARCVDDLGLASIELRTRASNRATYLRRPDLGRILTDESRRDLQFLAVAPCDVAIIVADGLSATAVQANAPAMLQHLVPRLRETGLTVAPVAIVTQGRVAIGDQIGAVLKPRISLILIGERPGLSSANSLGAYLTYAPDEGRSDADRNCLSNIRDEGLATQDAAKKAHWLIRAMLERGTSGIVLKDLSGSELLTHTHPGTNDCP